MTSRSLEQIFRALNEADARYLVVGGLAVVAHGFVRFTNDVDIVLDLESDNCLRAVRALAELGYEPLVPVSIEDFVVAANRQRWVHEKQAAVFPLFSDRHPQTRIDLFLEPPFDFDVAFARRYRQELGAGVRVPFVGLDDLIQMKRRAGRARDRTDIAKLEELRRAELDSAE